MNIANEPIATIHLFPLLDEKLIAILKQLQPDEWLLPTIAKQWTVKDIVAHLLDGNIRGLSSSRDHHFAGAPSSNSFADITRFINQHNQKWVQAAEHISTQVLVDLLQHTNQLYAQHLSQLPLFDEAIFAVAWAGESQSFNWMHIAREYTEKFIHQQQIRLAIGNDDLLTPQFFSPFAHTIMRALPYTFRHTKVAENTVVEIAIAAPCPGKWQLCFTQSSWQLVEPVAIEAAATAIIPPQTAWQLFSKGISAAQALPQIVLQGDKQLAEQVLQMVAVMA